MGGVIKDDRHSYKSLEVKQYLVKAKFETGVCGVGGGRGYVGDWPPHDIAIPNIVWCMYGNNQGSVGGVYYAMVVQ